MKKRKEKFITSISIEKDCSSRGMDTTRKRNVVYRRRERERGNQRGKRVKIWCTLIL